MSADVPSEESHETTVERNRHASQRSGEYVYPECHPEQFQDSPLGMIPKEWEVAPLGSLVDSQRPIVYGILMPGYGFPGGVPVVKVKDILGGRIQVNGLLLTSPSIDNEYRRSRLQGGDLLFTIRGTVGRMAFVPEMLNGANITQDTARIGVVRADPRYVRQYLEMPGPSRAFVETHTLGQAVKGINLRDVRCIPLAIPPLPEQHRIAEILKTLDEAIRKTEQVIAKLKQMKQGLLHDLLTRGIDENGELRDAERHPEQFQDSPLGRIPRGWEVKSLGALIKSHQAGVYKHRDLYGEGNNIVGVSDLFQHTSIRGQEFRRARLSAIERGKFSLRSGDLLYAESSLVLDGIAKTLAVDAGGEGTAFAWHTRRLEPHASRASGAFLAAALNTPRTRRFVIQRATQTALTGIPVAEYLETPVPLSPLGEQTHILAQLGAAEERVDAEHSDIVKLRTLKNGLMHDLLTGRVRVKIREEAKT